MKNIKAWCGISPSLIMNLPSNPTIMDKYHYMLKLKNMILSNPSLKKEYNAAVKELETISCFEEFEFNIIFRSLCNSTMLCLACFYDIYKFLWLVDLAKRIPKDLDFFVKDAEFSKLILYIDKNQLYSKEAGLF